MHKKSQRQWLNYMVHSKYLDYETDSYNQGPLVDMLESRVSGLLGKESSLFFNKGVTAQLAALKVACTNKHNTAIALHPQTHLVLDEENAYQELTGLDGNLIGELNKAFVVDDLKALKKSVAVVVVEMPLRRAGFKLPEWDELLKIKDWCNAHGVHLHMDGARLWESAPYYQKSFDEISALFDSVYVSLYKGIGSISGAILSGTEEFIQQCIPWRVRLGSHLWTTFPSIITSLDGLDKNLPQIPSWVSRAQNIAKQLLKVDGLIVDNPQCNSFQVRIKTNNPDKINTKLSQLESEYDMKVCRPFSDYPGDSSLKFSEIQVSADHKTISDDEIFEFFTHLSADL